MPVKGEAAKESTVVNDIYADFSQPPHWLSSERQQTSQGPVIYHGAIKVPLDGVYTLYFRPVGDGMLAVDGVEVLPMRKTQGTPMARWVKLPLKAGIHTILMHTTAGNYEFEWSGPDMDQRRLKAEGR